MTLFDFLTSAPAAITRVLTVATPGASARSVAAETATWPLGNVGNRLFPRVGNRRWVPLRRRSLADRPVPERTSGMPASRPALRHAPDRPRGRAKLVGMHSHLLGATAQHMPLIAAAVAVAAARAPQVILEELEALAGDGSARANVELRRAIDWLSAKCAEPNGLICAHQDPATGELLRIPASAIWQVTCGTPGPSQHDGEGWPELTPFREAGAQVLGHSNFDPRLEIVVPRTELDVLLGPERAIAGAWLTANIEEAIPTLQRVAGTSDAPIANWARTQVEQLPVLARLHAALTTSEEHAAETKPTTSKTSTKAAVATKEGDYRARWKTGEFASSRAALDALTLELNTRSDGSVAHRGDADYHSKPTIERLTRGWFR